MTKVFQNVLFVGIGGGNDVFSTTLAMRALQGIGWRWQSCAIAGVLSPFHRHSGLTTPIRGLTTITPSSNRFLNRRGDHRKIIFVDSAVAWLLPELAEFNITDVYGLSLQEGTIGLAETFQQLAKWFETFVLVDIGGDVLYSGTEDRHVLSPMFDATVLRAFTATGIKGVLFEAGPGTDGEIEPQQLTIALATTNAKGHDLDSETMRWWQDLYQRHIAPIRKGRTVPVMLDAWTRRETEPFALYYRFRAHLGSNRWYGTIRQRIDARLCKKFFLIDPMAIVNPFAVDCNGSYDWFVKTQLSLPHTNNEANLEYVATGNYLMQFVTPSPLFDADTRFEIATRCIYECAYLKTCDGCWILPADWQRLRWHWSHRMRVNDAGPMIELTRL